MDESLQSSVSLCSVCIATYRRPQLLTNLLDSLLAQTLLPHVTLEIIVIDNDSEESARAIVQNYVNAKFPIRYGVEPRKNISHARNKSVQLATGDYLLFVDDDETASAGWVMALFDTLHKYQADGVFGRVVSSFHSDAPSWIKTVYLFNRPAPLTGSIAKATRTSNCLIKASLLENMPEPFDASYGITGGEDTHLFGRLRKKGAHFINCYEGWVTEYIPPERTQTRWVVKRAYRTGNLFGRRKIELAEYKYFARLGNCVIGLANIFINLVLVMVFLPSSAKRWHWLLKTAANWGRILSAFNIKVNGY